MSRSSNSGNQSKVVFFFSCIKVAWYPQFKSRMLVINFFKLAGTVMKIFVKYYFHPTEITKLVPCYLPPIRTMHLEIHIKLKKWLDCGEI